MAIFTLELNLSKEQTELTNEIFKYVINITLFHILMSMSFPKKGVPNFGMTGDIFNEDFLGVVLILVIVILIYHLIIKELIEIK